MNKWQRKLASLVHPYRVVDGRRFRLSSIDPGDTEGFQSKRHAREHLARGIQMLGELQEKLYAQDRWALLLIFQAMDGAGKDSTIKHVMSGVNPQGCQVYSFKAPSDEELDHDFMWRTTCAPPRAGPDRHLQPVLLRGGAGRPGPPRATRPAAAAGEAHDPRHLAGAPRGHQRLRALPGPERRRRAEVLSPRVPRGTAPAIPRSARRAREELEVLPRRRPGAPPLGRVHGGLRGHDPPHELGARALVRRARRPQVVHPSGRGLGDPARRSRPSVSRSRPSRPTG